MPDWYDCLIGFGSNLGNSEQAFIETGNYLRELEGVSSLLESSPRHTQPIGGHRNQPAYLNAIFRLRTSLSATLLFKSLADFEAKLGRIRKERWQPRTLDLDLLLYSDVQLQSSTLMIPHPRMTVRRFVLEPAVEIAAAMVHPVAQRTLGQLLEHLQQTPNELLWVTDLNSISDRCAQAAEYKINQLHQSSDVPDATASDSTHTGWSIHCVQDRATFEAKQSTAKIVVWSASRPLELQNAKFFGPQVELGQHTEVKDDSIKEDFVFEEIENELVAAMQAANG